MHASTPGLTAYAFIIINGNPVLAWMQGIPVADLGAAALFLFRASAVLGAPNKTRFFRMGQAFDHLGIGILDVRNVLSFHSTSEHFFVQFIQCKHIDSPLKYGMLPFLRSSERCIHIHTPQPHVALYYIIYNLDNLCRPSFNIPDLVNPVFIKIRFVGNKDQGSLIVLEGTL